jgi:hypothetical protein
MQIPYGRSNFEEIRRGGYFYVDKTPFLPLLERGAVGYPLFLRPRRFGKSTFLSLLEHYYDLGRAEQFDDLFQGLWVHDHPTPERSRYLVLSFDFSQVGAGDDGEALRRAFFETVLASVQAFLLRYRGRHAALDQLYAALGRFQDAEALVGRLLGIVSTTRDKVYVLIDEYDNFANRLLSAGSAERYEALVTRTGFVRAFYATLKIGTASGAVGRMFITGVTPLMLNDLASGFNIALNISQVPAFNTLTGFTRADVERAVDELLTTQPELAAIPELSDRALLLDVMERSYDGYRFSTRAQERVFNPDMVLYFLNYAECMRAYPGELLDPNVRTDYGQLQRIGTMSGTEVGERRLLLESIVAEGHIRTPLVAQFGAKSLRSHGPFLSLLYYLGMLTLRDVPPDVDGHDLEIPNRVIRELQWEHLALMLEEQALVTVEVDALQAAFSAMATIGDIEPFLSLFHEQVIQAMSVRDTRKLDEKTIKLLLVMYASLGRAFYPLTEKEFAQGYCDVFLAATPRVPGARYAWLLELKYLKAGSTPARIEAAFAEAGQQVERYASDQALLPLLVGDRALKAGMLVFVGTKKLLFRPWPAPKARPKAAKRPASRRVPPRGGPSR